MNLKTLRAQKHLSQEQLAKMSGLNVRTIQRIETGETPSLETLKCLAATLEVDIDVLQQEDNLGTKSDVVISQKSMFIKHKKTEVITSTIVGIVFILFGAGNSESAPIVGATFYVVAAFCFMLVAFYMAKFNLFNKL